uniref:Uncharacterized protein n=1 Tax=Anguilla anguilla TaxID=7936 RepID=A0A0E9SWT8_ANGAN
MLFKSPGNREPFSFSLVQVKWLKVKRLF